MPGDAEAGHCRVADNLAEIALEPTLHMDDGLPALAIAQPPGVAAHLAAGQQDAFVPGEVFGGLRRAVGSGERRVGKEWVRTCRYRWWPDTCKKNKTIKIHHQN